MYLLDTNVVSELRRMRPHAGVVAWLDGIPNDQLRISAVTFGELQSGVEMVRRQDPAKAQSIEAWIDRMESTWNIIPVDSHTYRIWARLMNGQSDTLAEDALIAATALVHALTVVTRNVRDFVPLGVTTLNPFSPRA